MSMKIKLIIIVVFVLLTGFLCTCTYLFYKERNKTALLENDIRSGYETGFKILSYYKSKNGDLVAQNQVLSFTGKEFKNNISPSVTKNLDNLKVKPNRVEYYSETSVNSSKEISVPVKDSVIFDTVPCHIFHYADEFYRVDGILIGDTQKVKICSFDSIIQVVYKGSRYNRKGRIIPGIFFWIPRRLEQVICCKNPNSKVVYSKTIWISK